MLRTSIGYHTISLFLRLSWEEADALMYYFQHYSKKTGNIKIYKHPDIKNAYMIEFIGEDRGVKWILHFNNTVKEFRYYGIELIMNPKILADENDYVRAADETHLPKAIVAHNALVKEISDELPMFDMKLPLFANYLIKRIDYCINFDIRELGYFCDIDLLIELIRRGNIPYNFKEPYDKVKHRRKSEDNSFVLESGSMNINCYSKYAEWLSNHPDRFGIEESRYVIRFEVQCRRNKIRYMLNRKTRFMSEELHKFSPYDYLLSNEVSVKIVWDYFTQVIMQGDYYCLDEAIAMVKESPFRQQRQDRLIDTLELVANCQGIDNARKHICKFRDEKELRQFDWSLHDLAGMGINPVCIQRRKKVKCIPGLLRAFETMTKNK